MIEQGSNNPIVLSFAEMPDIKDISVALIKDNRISAVKPNEILKKWGMDDVEVDAEEPMVLCPLTQEETLSFPEGAAIIEAKWLDSDNKTWFNQTVKVEIARRFDKTLLMED